MALIMEILRSFDLSRLVSILAGEAGTDAVQMCMSSVRGVTLLPYHEER